jgi:hypothetical protein
MLSKPCFLDHNWKTVKIEDGFISRKCLKCGKKLKVRIGYSLKFASTQFGSKGIPGYNEPGYNEGLGKVIKNKREYYNEAKKMGAKPHG